MPKLAILDQINKSTGTKNSGTVTIKNIPIGEILVKENIRNNDTIEIQDLKDSIKSTGLLQPITVCWDGEDYICIIGHRRLQAYKELYIDNKDLYHSITAIMTDDKNITIRQLIENAQRVDLKPIELYHALKKLRGQGLKIKEIAVVIGKAEGYVKNLFSGIKEIESDSENMELLKSDMMSLSDFKTIKPIKDKADKKKLLKAKAEKKLTQKELQSKVKKKTPQQIVYEIPETEVRFIERALRQVLSGLKPLSKEGYKGQVLLTSDDYNVLSGLLERLSGAS